MSDATQDLIPGMIPSPNFKNVYIDPTNFNNNQKIPKDEENFDKLINIPLISEIGNRYPFFFLNKEKKIL